MTRKRKTQFWIDTAGGALVDFSADINSVSWSETTEINEDTGLNDADRQIVGDGLRSATVTLNGYYNETTANRLVTRLHDIRGTTISTTVQWLTGSNYWNAEVYNGQLEMSADGKALAKWSCTFEVDGAVNSTSVSLAA